MVGKGKIETILVSILITYTQTAVASGIITVQLVEYDHRDGKDADGKCCESIWSSGCKADECDPYFDLCLKNRTNGKVVSTKNTDRTSNVGHIHFGNNIGTTTNNIVLDFTGPLSDLDLNIKVFDSDIDGVFDKKDDLIEILTERVQLSPTTFSQQPSAFSDLQINGAKTSISLRYRAVCDQYYYGQECDVMCKPYLNYYTCDDHGNKSCLASQDCELSLYTPITTTVLHTIANSTTKTETVLHTSANLTTRTATALHNNSNLTTTAAIRLPSITTTSKHSLTNVTIFQISTRLPNVSATSASFRQSGMHIPFSTTKLILKSDYQKWSPTIRTNHVKISETKTPTVSTHMDPDVMTLLPIVGGAIAGTGETEHAGKTAQKQRGHEEVSLDLDTT
ncbi:hypothetical protein CHS0354_039547 [Potamilus streckersoni]|uniref:DSL domain-containing protein n=1 Tax=Potamilus streckersoni TaxID=2493646 RepID=A0AAE0TL75_9BIVA|nr:hypothetical protein CHS0354_039547 [Potamilus streckersoni]